MACLGLLLAAAAGAQTSELEELKDYSVDGPPPAESQDGGNTMTAVVVMEADEDQAEYVDNYWLQDFEVHFMVSLPFTAFYSYLSVLSIDAMVQGEFPPAFHQADMWMIIGVAIGSSVAIALGSINRVPDQSQYRLDTRLQPGEDNADTTINTSFCRLEFVKIKY